MILSAFSIRCHWGIARKKSHVNLCYTRVYVSSGLPRIIGAHVIVWRPLICFYQGIPLNNYLCACLTDLHLHFGLWESGLVNRFLVSKCRTDRLAMQHDVWTGKKLNTKWVKGQTNALMREWDASQLKQGKVNTLCQPSVLWLHVRMYYVFKRRGYENGQNLRVIFQTMT